LRRVMLLGALALFLAGCSTESALPTTDIPPFKVDPSVSLRLTGNSGGDVTVDMTALHFKAVDPADATSPHVYGEGHFHLFLDVPPTAPGEVTPHAPGIYHTPLTTYTIHGVKDGAHHLVVVLGYSDHLPYQDIIQKASASGGAIASIDFKTGANATPVTAAPSAAPTAAASSAPTTAASAPAGGGGGPTVHLVADAANGGAFNPGTVTVSVGGVVTWVWDDDSASHTVTADNNSFDSSLQSKGYKYTQTFKSAGTYKYHCAVHPQMLGTVKVQ
jgi:plastocyanin